LAHKLKETEKNLNEKSRNIVMLENDISSLKNYANKAEERINNLER
jgi:hypothetical protein